MHRGVIIPSAAEIGDGVGAGIDDEQIRAAAARERIITRTAIERIVTAAIGERRAGLVKLHTPEGKADIAGVISTLYDVT